MNPLLYCAAERHCVCPSPMVGSGEPPTHPPEPPGGTYLYTFSAAVSAPHPCLCPPHPRLCPPHPRLCSPPITPSLQVARCLSPLLEERLCVCPTPRSSTALSCAIVAVSSIPLPSTRIIAERTPSLVGRTSLDSLTRRCLNAQVIACCIGVCSC